MTESRPPRLRTVPPEVAAKAAQPTAATADAELLDRLTDALSALPSAERAAAVLAFGLDEGSSGVATGLELSGEDAEALTRNALQLLRGAMADAEADEGETFARLRARRRTAAPGD